MIITPIPAICLTIEQENKNLESRLENGGIVITFPQSGNAPTISFDFSASNYLNLEKMIDKAKSDLIEYMSFSMGWDGYNGKPISLTNISAAQEIMDILYEYFANSRFLPTEITPGPVADGSIDIEIASGDKCLIINVADSSDLGIYKEHGQFSDEYKRDISWQSLAEELTWFHGETIGEIQLA